MIALRLVKCPDGSIPTLAPRPLDANGVTIGRSPQCGLVLADPLRGVSRKHAWIAIRRGGDAALLRCISMTTPLAVNGERLEPGGEQVVKPGDRLRIGGFEFRLEDTELSTIPLPPAARAPPTPPATVLPPAMPTMPAMPTATAVPVRPSRLDALWDLETAPDPLGRESPLPPSSIGTMSAAPGGILAGRPDPIATVDLTALRSAFLRGAGLGEPTASGAIEIDAEWMAHVGALLRTTMVELVSRLGPNALDAVDDELEAVFGRELVRTWREQARAAAAQRNRA